MRAFLLKGLLCLSAVFSTATARDSAITSKQADDILAELRRIRAFLEQQNTPVAAKAAIPNPTNSPQPREVALSISGPPALGRINAPLTMVEFTDYQCQFCRLFQESVFKDIQREYIDTGRLRFYVHSLPLNGHPNAFKAAEAAFCASDQGHFWPMHEALISRSKSLDRAELVAFSKELNLNTEVFEECLTNSKHRTTVESDMVSAGKVGTGATPSFIVGLSTADGVNGEVIVGAMPFSTFQESLDKLLSRTRQPSQQEKSLAARDR